MKANAGYAFDMDPGTLDMVSVGKHVPIFSYQ